jgi:hypothetical protein
LYDWLADSVMVLLFLLDGAELPIVGEAAQPAAVHRGYPAGKVYRTMPSLTELPSLESGR